MKNGSGFKAQLIIYQEVADSSPAGRARSHPTIVTIGPALLPGISTLFTVLVAGREAVVGRKAIVHSEPSALLLEEDVLAWANDIRVIQ